MQHFKPNFGILLKTWLGYQKMHLKYSVAKKKGRKKSQNKT